eukprot:1797831-Rhodomonas_salina.2
MPAAPRGAAQDTTVTERRRQRTTVTEHLAVADKAAAGGWRKCRRATSTEAQSGATSADQEQSPWLHHATEREREKEREREREIRRGRERRCVC